MDYTINDPASVECPYCHEKMDLADEIAGMIDYDTVCFACNRGIHCKVNVEVTVLAWKEEAIEK